MNFPELTAQGLTGWFRIFTSVQESGDASYIFCKNEGEIYTATRQAGENNIRNLSALATKNDIPQGLAGKRILYGLTKVTTDANGAGWIPFTPNFADANSFLLIGQTDSNMVDRVATTIHNNGASVQLFKNGTAVANSHGWITWLAIGNPI